MIRILLLLTIQLNQLLVVIIFRSQKLLHKFRKLILKITFFSRNLIFSFAIYHRKKSWVIFKGGFGVIDKPIHVTLKRETALVHKAKKELARIDAAGRDEVGSKVMTPNKNLPEGKTYKVVFNVTLLNAVTDFLKYHLPSVPVQTIVACVIVNFFRATDFSTAYQQNALYLETQKVRYFNVAKEQNKKSWLLRSECLTCIFCTYFDYTVCSFFNTKRNLYDVLWWHLYWNLKHTSNVWRTPKNLGSTFQFHSQNCSRYGLCSAILPLKTKK